MVIYIVEEPEEISNSGAEESELNEKLRTRIKRLQRKTICFSKSEEMHDLVIELFINRYEARVGVLEQQSVNTTF